MLVGLMVTAVVEMFVVVAAVVPAPVSTTYVR